MSAVDDHSHWRDAVAAHVLGALGPRETAILERHLEGCASCRAELRWLASAAPSLPESRERVEAPQALRARILAEAGGKEAGDRGAA